MDYKKRPYPLFSACGLNCGLCPRYQTGGTSKCPGCAGEGFSEKHPSCGILSCCQRRENAYCFKCGEYPCKKYENADVFDSFISHRNQFKDVEKAKNAGLAAYQKELDEKVCVLEDLLENYNDGRRKSFFCTAVNLLPLQDLQRVMKRLKTETSESGPAKERSAAAVRLLQTAADRQNVSLKLRKKPSK